MVNRNRATVNPPQTIPFENQYLTFKALEAGTFQFSKACSYSLNDGTWTSLAAATDTPSLSIGDTIKWKASAAPDSTNGLGTFSSTGTFNAYGNPFSMRHGDDFRGKTSFSNDYFFYKLFQSSKVVSCEDLKLTATTLRAHCYRQMFYGCTNLTAAPELIATSSAPTYAYALMFRGCTSLTTIPSCTINISNTNNVCYQMFYGCSALVTAPITMQGTSIAYNGCNGMFYGCTSLTSAMSSLPATTASSTNVYNQMFYNCSSLTSAPSISLTTLTESCMAQMFRGCTSLVTPPSILPATTAAKTCYNQMFYGCSKLETAPELPMLTLGNSSYKEMFRGCTKLAYVKCLATSISATDCLYQWMNGVASSGTFVKHPDMASWSRGTGGIPTNWTVEDAIIS